MTRDNRSHRLSPEIVSLVHHVELSQAGWCDKIVEQLIAAQLWLLDNSVVSSKIRQALSETFGIDVSQDDIDTAIKQLDSDGIVACTSANNWTLSENGLRLLKNRLEDSKSIDSKVKDLFSQHFTKYCPHLAVEDAWKRFNDQLLLPIIEASGARVYELLAGKRSLLADTNKLEDFLNEYEANDQLSLRLALSHFLDPRDANIRAYVLKYLNAYFYLEAHSLTSNTLDALSISDHNYKFIIYIDTNFLFSFLEMNHDDDNALAYSLLNLPKEFDNNIRIQLIVSPTTLKEVKHVLQNQIDRFTRYEVSVRHANLCASPDIPQVDGFLRYISRATLDAGRKINGRKLLQMFHDNLTTILDEKGIRVKGKPLDTYLRSTQIKRDIARQRNAEEEENITWRKKAGAWPHDVALWHCVNDQRPNTMSCPLDACYWIATLDQHYCNFDQLKMRYGDCIYPVCVNPPDLISMLQFLVPRNPLLEENLLRSLRVCFFHKINPATERVTTNILESLSYYESITAFSRDTLKSILLNEALRSKLESHHNPEENREAVKEVILEEQEKIDEAGRKQTEVTSNEIKNLTNTNVALKVSIGVLSTIIFEILTFLLPWNWLLKHENSYAIHGLIILFILSLFCGWAFRQVRKYAWSLSFITLLPLAFSLLKGPPKI